MVKRTKVCQCCNEVFEKDPRVNPKQWARQRFCCDACRKKKCSLEACERRGFDSSTSYFQTMFKYGSISAAARAQNISTRTLERRLCIEGGYCGSCGIRKIDKIQSVDKCAICYSRHYTTNEGWRLSKEGKCYNHQYVRTERYRKQHREVANRYNHTEKGWHASRAGFVSRRDRKKKVGGDGLSTEKVKLIREAYGNKCLVCGITQKEHYTKYHKSLHLDHFNPLSTGHPIAIDNVVLLCHFHNGSKGSQNPYDFFTQEQIIEIKKVWSELCQRKN